MTEAARPEGGSRELLGDTRFTGAGAIQSARIFTLRVGPRFPFKLPAPESSTSLYANRWLPARTTAHPQGSGSDPFPECQRRLNLDPSPTGWFPAVIATLGTAVEVSNRVKTSAGFRASRTAPDQ